MTEVEQVDGELKEKKTFWGELELGDGLFQEDNARDCQEVEELRRVCCEETDRARQAKIDELSMHQERNPPTVSQLMDQTQELQNNVTSLSDARDFFTIMNQGAALERPRSQSTVHYSKSQNLASLRFWIAARCTEYCGYFRKRFWTTTCSRRTILCSLQQFKEFDIF